MPLHRLCRHRRCDRDGAEGGPRLKSAPGLTPPYAIEVVNYRLVEGTDPKAFLAINHTVGREFTSAQPGFLHREIGCSEDGTWLVAVYWQSAEHARRSIGNIETIPETVKTYMGSIDRATLTRTLFDIE